MFWRKRQSPFPVSGGIRHVFHGVAVEPADGCRCAAVAAIEGQRFLSEDAPRLPLDGCDRPHVCRCRYRHFPDRRTDLRREADHGLPARFYLDEKRNGRGRRITDF